MSPALQKGKIIIPQFVYTRENVFYLLFQKKGIGNFKLICLGLKEGGAANSNNPQNGSIKIIKPEMTLMLAPKVPQLLPKTFYSGSGKYGS